MRKGYKYDKIKAKLEESGIAGWNRRNWVRCLSPELRHEIQLYKEKMRKAEMNGILKWIWRLSK